MRTRMSLGLAAIAAGVSTLTLAVPPAYADTGAFTMQGAGTITPGLTTTPQTQTFTFVGSGPLIDASQPSRSGVYECYVNGASSAAETALVGAGNFSGACSGPASMPLTGTYTRDGTEVVITGSMGTPFNSGFTGVCLFTPNSAPSVNSYRVECEIALH